MYIWYLLASCAVSSQPVRRRDSSLAATGRAFVLSFPDSACPSSLSYAEATVWPLSHRPKTARAEAARERTGADLLAVRSEAAERACR
jgi:hypothetical protein